MKGLLYFRAYGGEEVGWSRWLLAPERDWMLFELGDRIALAEGERVLVRGGLQYAVLGSGEVDRENAETAADRERLAAA